MSQWMKLKICSTTQGEKEMLNKRHKALKWQVTLPVSFSPVTVSSEDPLLDIPLISKTPLILPLSRVGVPMFKDLNGEREGARVLPVWYVGMRRLHGISDFFVELLNLLSDYLQRPRAQEAQQIFVIRGRFPEISLGFRNSHLPGSFPWKPARGGFLCHALAAALPNQIQRMWENEFCN